MAIRVLIASVSLGLLSLVLFTGPVADIDFWWHVNSGRWIWTQHALPAADPLQVYPQVNEWARNILQGQWGGQVGLYLVFEKFGNAGVIAFRVFVMGLALALVAWRLAATRAPRIARLVAIVAAGIVFSGFAVDRPQLFSLLCFALLIAVLERARDRRHIQWLIPLVLVVWTNLHQGVLLGAAVAALEMALTAMQDMRQGDRRGAMQSGLIAVAALLSPFATPNGFSGIEYLVWLEFNPAKQRISEYASPFSYLSMLPRAPHLVVFFAFAAVMTPTLARRIWQEPLRGAVPLILLVLGLFTYRYIPFAVMAGLPFLLAYPPFTVQNPTWRRGAAVGAIAGAALAMVFLVQVRLPFVREGLVSSSTMPLDLTREGKRLNIAGNIFTTVSWGGYLGWEFGSAAHPFIDGRFLLDPLRLEDYTHILWATPRGQSAFAEANFDWVLMPHRNELANDRPYPIIDLLRADPAWQLHAETPQGVLFSRIQ